MQDQRDEIRVAIGASAAQLSTGCGGALGAADTVGQSLPPPRSRQAVRSRWFARFAFSLGALFSFAAQQTEGHADAGARTETKRGLHVLYCEIRLSGPELQGAADVPAAREAGVERQSTVDQRHHGTEILAEIAQRKGGIGDGAGIVTGYLQSPTGEIDALATVRRWIIAPGVQAAPIVAERGPSESRPIMRISFDRFFEKLQ